ncbi:MAG TPA: NAD(P)H-hydrate epimerase, partial [Candidatus Dorea intestinavium]|nr:NAD(P)H-hydrate epimerase [Candidatus Dorea intestinavium]
MFYLPTGSEMQQADYDTINRLNIPALTLMEKAGEVCVQAMLAEKIDLTTVLILVGNGNNGGDGLVIARLLLEAGYQVSILWQGRKEKLSAEAKVNYDRLQKYAVPFYEEFPLKSFSLIIDTLFGVGLNRPIAGKYHQIIEAANKVKAIKLAIDIPSGISSETGLLLGIAFKADYTIAIQNKKLGHLLEDGRYYCGKIITKEIGISNEILKSNKQVVLGYEKKDYQQLLPLRDRNSNKGSFG